MVRRAHHPSVLHIVGSLQGGGAERCVRELVPRLRVRGTDAEIATVYLPNLEPAEITALGCNVFFRPKSPGFDARHLWWLSRVIAERKPQIVHTHQWAGKYVGRLAAILAGVPLLVHTEHSPNPVVGIERLFTQLFWRRTSAVVTFAEENAAIIRRREPVSRLEIIRNGLAIPELPSAAERARARNVLGLHDGEVAFGIVASLQERKNHRLAFEALARIKDESSVPIRLCLFGDGPLRSDLTALAAALGISNLVAFYGFRSDVRDLLPGLDVFVSVSKLEMAPISILEAMTCCIPVIATPHAGAADLVDNGVTGSIVDWSVRDVAAAMQRARDDAEWRLRCGLEGRKRVERNHDIEMIADQHVRFYDRLVGHSVAV
jgi:glycosyltransferase involved in cell wall biosynthesis